MATVRNSSLTRAWTSSGPRTAALPRRATLSNNFSVPVKYARRAALAPRQRRHSPYLRVRAEENSTRKAVNSAIKAGNQALDTAASLLPANIPKPIGKAGVGLVGLTIALSLVQAVFNSFVTLLFLGGVGYLAFTYLSKGEGKSVATGEDPLEEARKIMDKYK